MACRDCRQQRPAGQPGGGFQLGALAPKDSLLRPRPKPAETPAAPSTPMPAPPRAIDARTAYQLVSMMRDVVQRGTGVQAKVLGREDVGGKTGSTNDHRDAWFSGFGGRT